ncbi:MAG: hypothetical protein ACQET5_05440 [Halobacteriota archaeon]
MHRVSLETLFCHQPITGSSDDLLLEVRLNGDDRREPYVLRKKLSAGEDWSIGRGYVFETSVEFTLRRWVDASPTEAGTSTLTPTTSESLSFDENGVYELDVSLSQPEDDKLERTIADFEDSSRSSVWTGLGPKEGLTARVRELTDHSKIVKGVPHGPFSLDQDGADVCGPAGVGFTFAFRFPRRFVELCRTLYERGAFLGEESAYETSGTLRRQPFPNRDSGMSGDENVDWEGVWDDLPMHPLDWMIMAGIGDIQSAFITSAPGSEEDALGWLDDVLGYDTTGHVKPDHYQIWNAEVSVPWEREEKAEKMFKSAHDAVDGGGIAYLLVNATAFWRSYSGWSGYQEAVRNHVRGPSISHLVTLANSTWAGEGGEHEMVVHDNGRLRHRPVTADDLEEFLAAVVTGES